MGIYFTRDGHSLFSYSDLIFQNMEYYNRFLIRLNSYKKKKIQAANLIFRWQLIDIALPLNKGLILQIGTIKNKPT